MNDKILEELIREKEIKLQEKNNQLAELEGIILVKKQQQIDLKREIKEDEKQLEKFKNSFEYVKGI